MVQQSALHSVKKEEQTIDAGKDSDDPQGVVLSKKTPAPKGYILHNSVRKTLVR